MKKRLLIFLLLLCVLLSACGKTNVNNPDDVTEKPDTTATYFSKTEYTNDKFEAELDLAPEPLYEGCSNDEWSVRFLTYNSTFGEADDFYATLIDENTLLLQHLYPFDGTQGVSYQTYVRK